MAENEIGSEKFCSIRCTILYRRLWERLFKSALYE